MPLAPRRPASSLRARGSRRLRPLAEPLEGRALLAASIGLDAEGVLTYRTDGDPGFKVTISASEGSYLVEADQPIQVVEGDVTGGGSTVVAAAGVSRLVVETGGHGARVWIKALDVPADVRVDSMFSQVILGAWDSPAGLSAVTAPVVVTAGPNIRDARVDVVDYGSPRPAEYTITADAVAATGGFGGVTFSGLTYLGVDGSSTGPGTDPSRFNILGVPDGTSVGVISRETAGGRSVFVLDAAEPATDGSVNMQNQHGEATFLIRKTASPVGFTAFGEAVHVVASDDGSTAGIRHAVHVVSVVWTPVDLVVDDSAGDAARDATLAVWSESPLQRDGKLLGAAGPGGEIRYTSPGLTSVAYKGARGRAGSFTVDIDGGESFPDMGGRTIAYDGGYDGTAGGRLTIRGTPPEGPAAAEVHTAAAPGAGSLAFTFAGDASGLLEYSGLAPDGLIDLVPALSYRFEYRGPGEALATITDGTTPGESTIASGATPPAFTTTTISNKAAVEGVAPAPIAIPPDSTTPPPTSPEAPVETPVVEPAPTPTVDPVAPPPAAPAGPEAQSGGEVVGDGHPSRFGAAMRTSSGPRTTPLASSPFRRLREARIARLGELHLQRLGRLHAIRESRRA